MWPLPSIRNEYVSFCISPKTITASWFTKQHHHTTLQAHATYEKQYTQSISSVSSANQVELQHALSDFLGNYNLQDAFISFCLEGFPVIEQFVSSSNASPTRQQLESPTLKKCVWIAWYAYPEENKFIFYTAGIRQEHLISYQLFASTMKINLISITTSNTALMEAYKHIHSKTFRHAQLTTLMKQHDNDLTKCFSSAMLAQSIQIDKSTKVSIDKDSAHIAQAFGTFLLGSTHG